MKRLLFAVLLFLSPVCLAETQTESFIVEVEHNNQSFSIKKPAPHQWPATSAIGMEPSREAPADTTDISGYPGSDSPPDDNPHRPSGFWQTMTTVVEPISWQPLYATREVVGYTLILTLQKQGSLPESQPFLWLPVLATVVVGWLTRNHWNPESPLFSRMDEQESSEQHELQIITLMDSTREGSSWQCLLQQKSQTTGSYHSFSSGGSASSSSGRLPGNSGGGGGFPPDPTHTFDEHCPVYPCNQAGLCINAPTGADQHLDTCRCQDCLAQLDVYNGSLSYSSFQFAPDPAPSSSASDGFGNSPVVPAPELPEANGQYSCRYCTDGFCLVCINRCPVTVTEVTHCQQNDFCSAVTTPQAQSSSQFSSPASAQTVVIAQADSTTIELRPPPDSGVKHSGQHTCTKCGKTLATKKKLSDHNRNHHTGQQTCPTCGIKLVNKKALENHNRSRHTGRQTCTKCGAKLVSKQALADHNRRHHTGQQTCTECDKTLVSQKALDQHKRTHRKRKHVNADQDHGLGPSEESLLQLQEPVLPHLRQETHRPVDRTTESDTPGYRMAGSFEF